MSLLHDANLPIVQGAEKLPANVGVDTPDLVDRVLKTREREMALKALGRMTGDKEGNGESLAASIVNKALDVNLTTNKELRDQIQKSDAAIVIARGEADKAKGELYQVIANQVGAALQKLEKVQEDIHQGKTKSEKSLVEQVKEARDLLTILSPEQKAASSVSSASEYTMNLTLQQMAKDHELNMKKFDLEIEKMRTDLQFKLAQLADEAKWKEREWEDNKDYKKNALNRVTEIAASIAAGFTGGPQGDQISGQPIPAYSPINSQPPPMNEPQIFVKSFPCQGCGEAIAIPDDATEVLCPTPNCGMAYTINSEVKA